MLQITKVTGTETTYSKEYSHSCFAGALPSTSKLAKYRYEIIPQLMISKGADDQRFSHYLVKMGSLGGVHTAYHL